ncbi:MAG: GntR family transcriptional regulator [Rhodoglobus sp.]|nr:GntR family transcriptional regulator [Rhodoglobus sp.]
MQENRRKPAGIQARVTEQVRAQIIDGTLAPGDSLSEFALAEEYGVSRTPVREALKQLQTEGLVVIRPRVGTFVATPSRREIQELFHMKELFEGSAARLLAMRGEVPEVAALRQNVINADAAVASGDAQTYAALVGEFHDLIIQGSDNTKLVTHYRTMMNQLAYPRLVMTSLSKPGRLAESEDEHHRVLELILAKDGTTAERVMREHVRASQQALLDAMDAPAATTSIPTHHH